MSIVSLGFFIFAAIVFAEYWLCPARFRWLVLLAGSALFFLAGTEYALPVCAVFLGETLLTYLAALALQRLRSDQVKSLVTACTAVLLVLILILYKDLGFFVGNANRAFALLGSGLRLELPEWLAPFGVSYYTLILVGYLLDVRWGTVEAPERNPLKLLLFAGYFPQLTSGPISRYGETGLFRGAAWSWEGFRRGLLRFAWGLCKKLVLADRLAPAVSALFDGELLTGALVPLAAALYIAQLYADFSGCMDIVIGVSGLFGVPLAENFRRPFAAGSLSELWRRWHITLGLWVRSYVMYPVLRSGWMGRVRGLCKARWGKKASREVPTYIAMFITWFCVGFWHGGSWKYIFGSGLFFFAMIAGGMLLEPWFQKLADLLHVDREARWFHRFRQVRSFCLFAAAVSFDRCASFGAGLRAWKSVFTRWSFAPLLDLGLSGKDLLICGAGLLAVLAVSTAQERLEGRDVKVHPALAWLAVLVLLAIAAVFGCYGPGYEEVAFIYAAF